MASRLTPATTAIDSATFHSDERPQQVGGIGHDGVPDTHDDGVALERGPLLCGEGDHARHGGHGEERQLLDNQVAQRLSTPQWPVVEQQQREGQRHGHRLAEKRRGRRQQHRGVTPANGETHPARVGPDRQQPEQRAQDPFAFGDPGHRFDVQRVQAKQQRHERRADP
jgi:hypothetical protein